MADAAERLFLHRNGVHYRLHRWKELTGWDPRRMEELLRSVVAARAARAADAD
jgi:DNA-binding PucR family transcriptional regulator